MNNTMGRCAEYLADEHAYPETVLLTAEEVRELGYVTSYFSSDDVQDGLTELANAWCDGKIENWSDVLDYAMEEWDEKNPPPSTGDLAKWEEWEDRRFRAALNIDERLDHRLERIARGIDDAHLGVVRPDTHSLARGGLHIPDDGLLTDRQISALMAGRNADGEHIEGKRYAVARDGHVPIGSYAFIVSPEKTVSVAWALSGPEDQKRIMDAHLHAARDVMAHISTVMGYARIRGHAAEPGHVTSLEFTHHTSRPSNGQRGDPDIHTHFVMPNAVFCESGRVGSLDTAALRSAWLEVDLHYNRQLYQYLDNYGFNVHMKDHSRVVDITDVPREVVVAFSKRMEDNHGNKDEIRDFAHTKNVKDDIADFPGWRQQARQMQWDYPAQFRRQEHKKEGKAVRTHLSTDEYTPNSPRAIRDWIEHGQRM